MRMDIDIRVRIPSMTATQRLDFIEDVMAAFRKAFPEAERLPPISIDVPSPVTVTFRNDDGTPVDLSYKEPQDDRDQS